MSTPTEIQAALLQSAQQYQHNVIPQAVLEPHKDPILLLRAKYASYEKITDLLTTHGVQVSVATVRKFCRRHNGEMKRLRAEIEADRRATEGKGKPSISGHSTPSAERPPLTSEIGKRGPRIARDEL